MKPQLRCLLLVLALLGSAAAAFAQDSSSSIVLRDPSRFNESHFFLGAWKPDARSDFWDDNFQNFKASRSDTTGFAFTGDVIHHFDRHSAILLSGGVDITSINEPARNVRDENGNPLEHHLNLNLFSLTAGYLFYPAGTESKVIPYLGAGGGFYGGELRGYRSSFTTDDCDEDGNCTTEFVDSESSTFLTVGGYALAGLEFPVRPNLALLLEGRYSFARANLGRRFGDHNDLDLSGAQYTAGVAFHF
jgi:opacity protein-like surface antigen